MKPGAASTASHSTRMTRSASRRHRSPSKTPAKKPNKRNFEDSSEGEEEVEIDELEEDEKPPVKKKKNNTRKRAATPKKTGGSADTNGEWTAVKRALLVEKLIDAGYKHLDLNEVASELGLSKRQLINQLGKGRVGNIRDKCIRLMKEEE